MVRLHSFLVNCLNIGTRLRLVLGLIVLLLLALNAAIEPARSGEEQASVAKEVDRNLVTIRDLGVQTASGVEQTSGASRELARLAVGLRELVGAFKVY
jgi:methyl-accepting chemotaxis protein